MAAAADAANIYKPPRGTYTVTKGYWPFGYSTRVSESGTQATAGTSVALDAMAHELFPRAAFAATLRPLACLQRPRCCSSKTPFISCVSLFRISHSIVKLFRKLGGGMKCFALACGEFNRPMEVQNINYFQIDFFQNHNQFERELF